MAFRIKNYSSYSADLFTSALRRLAGCDAVAKLPRGRLYENCRSVFETADLLLQACSKIARENGEDKAVIDRARRVGATALLAVKKLQWTLRYEVPNEKVKPSQVEKTISRWYAAINDVLTEVSGQF